MELEGIIRETKKFFVKQIRGYEGRRENAKINFAKAAIAGLAAYCIDSDIVQVLSGAYAVIKAAHFAKDMCWPYKSKIEEYADENRRADQRNKV